MIVVKLHVIRVHSGNIRANMDTLDSVMCVWRKIDTKDYSIYVEQHEFPQRYYIFLVFFM